MTRVLVVEDSITARRHIVDALSRDPAIVVVGEAGTGKQAIDLCAALRPDVVTLDMMLPEMTGLEATEHIMAFCPTPILIVSASTNRGELFRTYDALAAGAVDVLDKNADDDAGADWDEKLVAAVKLVARVRVITHPRARLRAHGRAGSTAPNAARATERGKPARSTHLIAIGASTGGPAALTTVLGALPSDFALPVLVALHISKLFAYAIAEWLDEHCELPVRYALDGEPLPSPGRGIIVMAPPDRHLVVRAGRLWLSNAAERHSCRPSVDVLFESVASELHERAAGCLLTGMGKDGALGLLAMRRSGARTVAQDEATSVVFGMPREAIRAGAAEQVLPLEAIAPAILEWASQSVEDKR